MTTPYAYDWQELLDGLDMKALQSPQGVPFSSLPDELQQEIRRATSWEIKHDAIRATALAQRAEGDWKLHVRPNNYPTEFSIKFFDAPIPDRLGPPVIDIMSDERSLATLSFTTPKPATDPNAPTDADAAR